METKTTDGSVAAPIPVVSGAQGHGNRTTPCVPKAVLSAPAAGVLSPIIARDGAGEPRKHDKGTRRKRTSSNPAIHEAMRLLDEQGYIAYRTIGRNERQVSIIAMKGQDELMITVVSSRKPVQDAKTLLGLFPAKVTKLRTAAKSVRYKTMIWVISPIAGWRYYRVDIGGISYDWDFAKKVAE